ncbi:MAG: GxxExxY protein [Anaerolineales bacterium]|nr:MAG: GxxExxY protein [Anaerolineales bacterium]
MSGNGLKLVQEINKTTEAVIGAAIEVHKHLGPGLLESAYEECLCHELNLRNIPFKRQMPLPINYKGTNADCSYRIDLLVNDEVIVELKSVESISPIHEAQTLTYMRLGNWKVGLILNFNVPILVKGVKRLVLGLKE